MPGVGNLGPVELPSSRSYDVRTGWTVVRRFRGQADQIQALALVHKRAGARIEVSPDEDGQWWTLLSTYGADDSDAVDGTLSDTWTLTGNDLEKSIWEHPMITKVSHADVDPTSEDAVAKAGYWRDFHASVNAFVEGKREIETDNGSLVKLSMKGLIASGALLTLPKSTVVRLVACLLRGVESWPVSQWVLRHNVVVGPESRVRPSLANIGRIFTTAQLRLAERVPVLPKALHFDLPAGVWLKRTPSMEQSGIGKWTITQEWWHADSYDPFVYEKAVL